MAVEGQKEKESGRESALAAIERDGHGETVTKRQRKRERVKRRERKTERERER